MTKTELQARIAELEWQLRSPIGRVESLWGSYEECVEFIRDRLPADEVDFIPSGEGHMVVLKWR